MIMLMFIFPGPQRTCVPDRWVVHVGTKMDCPCRHVERSGSTIFAQRAALGVEPTKVSHDLIPHGEELTAI